MKPTILLRRIPNLAPFNNARLSSGLSNYQKFWKWTTQTRPSWKESKKEAAVLFVVFGVTGSASVALVRPALKDLIGLEGSFVDGPNSYRVLSILLVSPMYAVVLFTLGTLSGRHNYFAQMSRKIIGRMLPKKVTEKVTCAPARSNKPL